jgi:micrococcal nuclease
MRFRRDRIMAVWIVVLWAMTVAAAEPRIPDTEAVVKWVADGDTVILTDGRRLRYVGINCPEVAHDENPTEPFGDAARRMNQKLVAGRSIRLAAAGNDRYGRLLAAVFLSDGTFVNQALVAAGLAYVLPNVESKPFAERLLGAQREAMSDGRGLWAHLERNPTALIGNRRSYRFHRADCPFGKKIGKRHRVAFPDLYQAFTAGYAPCRRCFPRLEELLKVTSD